MKALKAFIKPFEAPQRSDFLMFLGGFDICGIKWVKEVVNFKSH